jgi:hypothetical protein
LGRYFTTPFSDVFTIWWITTAGTTRDARERERERERQKERERDRERERRDRRQ